MTQIKSEKAKEYIWAKIPWVYLDCAVKAISIAEKEAEERHAKELQELKDKAIEAFCKGMCDERECRANHGKCTRFKDFTQKLNEK